MKKPQATTKQPMSSHVKLVMRVVDIRDGKTPEVVTSISAHEADTGNTDLEFFLKATSVFGDAEERSILRRIFSAGNAIDALIMAASRELNPSVLKEHWKSIQTVLKLNFALLSELDHYRLGGLAGANPLGVWQDVEQKAQAVNVPALIQSDEYLAQRLLSYIEGLEPFADHMESKATYQRRRTGDHLIHSDQQERKIANLEVEILTWASEHRSKLRGRNEVRRVVHKLALASSKRASLSAAEKDLSKSIDDLGGRDIEARTQISGFMIAPGVLRARRA